MSSNPVNPITITEVMNMNHTITEGESGVRDMHLLQSAMQRPHLVVFGEAQFPSLLEKAAALFHSLAYHHLFYDGNKRTAVQAVTLFLARNGVHLAYDVARDYDFVLEVAQGQHDVPAITGWLRDHVR